MRLTAGQRAAVAVRIEFARAEIADAQEYASLDWATYQTDAKARRNVERIAENVANAAADTAKILLAGRGSAVPETYREVLTALAPAGLAESGAVPDLVRLAQLRNTLSHRYLDHKWALIKWFIDNGRSGVGAWLDRCERVIAPE